MLQAHEYWGMKRLAVDLVILNERLSSYVQDLQIAIEALARTSQSRVIPGVDRATGRVYVLRTDLISYRRPGTSAVRFASGTGRTARVACRSARPRARCRGCEALPAKQVAAKAGASPGGAPASEPSNSSTVSAGSPVDGREYVTVLGPGQSTPPPWINVIANPSSASRSPTEGAASPGPSTAATSSSRRGRTIR